MAALVLRSSSVPATAFLSAVTFDIACSPVVSTTKRPTTSLPLVPSAASLSFAADARLPLSPVLGTNRFQDDLQYDFPFPFLDTKDRIPLTEEARPKAFAFQEVLLVAKLAAMSLLDYESAFSLLNLHTAGTHTSPHKVAMLLAVMDLIEDGTLSENRIEYSTSLTKAFAARFKKLRTEGDSSRPIYPYFHLRNDGFWHHHLKPGQSEPYGRLGTVTSRNQIDRHIAYAYLDDELFELLGNHTVRELLRAALLESMTITPDERRARLQVNGWDWLECEACVQDYFDMLGKELRNEKYNKTAHRRVLIMKLNGRSRSSVERKHQNISAILVELGFTYISGYKPLFNYQAQLRDAVLAHLAGRRVDLEQINTVHDVDPPSFVVDWDRVLDPDIPDHIPVAQPPERHFLARHVNYTQREAANRRLGESGERFVLDFERYKLTLAGRTDLASDVEWSSKEQGDGLGYDIRSFHIGRDGVAREEEVYIEVKTTNRGKFQPFYISENEVAFSRKFNDQYSLYRVYDFCSRSRRLYQMPGLVENHVRLDPVVYRAGFG